MSTTNVFVSYSHDSDEHKAWVRELATRLRGAGIDATLDQWDLHPGDDIPTFVERGLTRANRVVMICTERYVIRANAGDGGVGYEKMIVTASLLKKIDSNAVIPIIRQPIKPPNLPTFLSAKLYLDFSNDSDFEPVFDSLTRTILGVPLYKKPPLGKRHAPKRQGARLPRRDGASATNTLRKLLRAIIESPMYSKYDQYPVKLAKEGDYSDEKIALRKSGLSEERFWELAREADEKGLLEIFPEGGLRVTRSGHSY